MTAKHAAETTMVTGLLGFGNLMAALQGFNWGAVSLGITGIGSAAIALLFKLKYDQAKNRHDIALLNLEVAQKTEENDHIVAMKNLELQAARRRLEDSAIEKQLMEMRAVLESNNQLLAAKEAERQSTADLAKELTKQLDEMRAEQADKRHKLRDDVNTVTTSLELKVAKGLIGVNKNADAVDKLASVTGVEVESGHVSDSSGDFATLPEGGIQ